MRMLEAGARALRLAHPLEVLDGTHGEALRRALLAMSEAEPDESVVEAVARAICSQSCRLHDSRGERCIDPVTLRNAPCRATSDQITLSYLGVEARAAIRAALRKMAEG